MNGHINLPKQSAQPNPAKVTTALSMSFGCVRKAGIRLRNRVLCACCLSPSVVEYSWSCASDLNGSWTNSLMVKISSISNLHQWDLMGTRCSLANLACQGKPCCLCPSHARKASNPVCTASVYLWRSNPSRYMFH